MTVVYPAIFHPNDDETITITFPDLPGCVSEGKGLLNAMYMARDGLALYLDTEEMLNIESAPPSDVADIIVEPGEYVTLIDADPEFYRRRRMNKAIKRTLSIPEWMDTAANQAGLSLSKVLQDALRDRFDTATQ